MSRKSQFLTLSLIVGVSIVFGMVLSTSLNRVDPIRAEAAGLSALPAPPPVTGAIALPSFADIAARSNPAVVAIHSVEFKKVRPQRTPSPNDLFRYFFSPEDPHRQIPRDQSEGDDQQEEERRQDGSGSGFIIRKDGYILTNNHVIDGASKLTVTLDNGEKYDATVKGKDESTDIALLKIEVPHPLPELQLGDSDSLRVGEWVLAIGNPLGSELGDEHSVTIGVVSAKGRQLRDINRDPTLANYIQTDAAINFGNSGGPLLNARGDVIGINTAITRNYGNYQGLVQGIGFALPINLAKNVVPQLMSEGKVTRGALEIGIRQVTDEQQAYYKLGSKKGAFVETVDTKGPASRAGMKMGDIILSVDGKEISDTAELIGLISARKPGETVTVGVLRDGRPMTLKVKLTDRVETLRANKEEGADEGEEGGDEGAAKPATAAKLGFTVTEFTPAIEREMEIPRHHVDGVVVTKVSPESRAYETGLREGMILTQIGDDQIASLGDFKAAAGRIKKGEIVRLNATWYVKMDEVTHYFFFKAE